MFRVSAFVRVLTLMFVFLLSGKTNAGFIPDGFENEYENSSLEVDIYLFSNQVGTGSLDLLGQRLHILELNDLPSGVLTKAASDWIRSVGNIENKHKCSAEMGKEIKCEVDSVVTGFEADSVNAIVELYISPQLIEKEYLDLSKTQSELWPDSSTSSQVTGKLDYSLNVSGSSRYSENYSGRLSPVISKGNYSVAADYSVSKSGDNKNSQLNEFVWYTEAGNKSYSFGLQDSFESDQIDTVYDPNTDFIGFMSMSSNKRKKTTNSNESSLPVDVTASSPGRAEIYRNNELIDTQSLEVGVNRLDTGSWPSGIYDVEVVILVGDREERRVSHTVYKNRKGNADELIWQFWTGVNVDSQDEYTLGLKAGFSPWLGGNTYSGLYLDLYNSFELGISQEIFGNNLIEANAFISDKSAKGADIRLSTEFPMGISGFIKYSTETGTTDSVSASLVANSLLKKGIYTSLSHRRTIDGSAHNTSLLIDKSSFLCLTNICMDAGFSLSSDSSYDLSEYTVGLNFSLRERNLSLNETIQVTSGNGKKDEFVSTTSLDVTQDYDDSIMSSSRITTSYARNNFRQEQGTIGVSTILSSSALTGNAAATFRRQSDSQTSTDYVDYYSNIQGSIAASQNGGWVVSGNSSDSGIIVEINDSAVGKVAANIDGHLVPLTGKKNYLPMKAYRSNNVSFQQIVLDEDVFEPLHIEAKSYRYSLHQGNIGYIKIEAVPTIEIIGQIYTDSGEAAAGIHVKNHVSGTYTDNEGLFSLSISKEYPVITIASKQGTFEYHVDTSKGSVPIVILEPINLSRLNENQDEYLARTK